jgi:hypothetical protein
MGVEMANGRSLKPPSPRAFRSSKEAPTPKPGLFFVPIGRTVAEGWPARYGSCGVMAAISVASRPTNASRSPITR